MVAKKAPSILAGYFNTGTEVSVGGSITIGGETRELFAGVPSKRPLKEFAAEMKELTDEEKGELVRGVCAITNDTVPDEYMVGAK